MNVLIAYATSEGQTRKVAERTATLIREQGHHVDVRDSAASGSGESLETFGGFILAASVHQRQHQESMTDFVIAHRKFLDGKPSAFISVSLSAALDDERAEAQEYVDHFMSVTEWQPGMTLLLGGALRPTEYDYFQEQIVKFVVMEHDDPTTAERDYEFTDWNALANFIGDFLAMAGPMKSGPADRIVGGRG